MSSTNSDAQNSGARSPFADYSVHEVSDTDPTGAAVVQADTFATADYPAVFGFRVYPSESQTERRWWDFETVEVAPGETDAHAVRCTCSAFGRAGSCQHVTAALNHYLETAEKR